MSMAHLGEGMTWSAGTPDSSVVLGAGADISKPQLEGRASTQNEQQIVGNLISHDTKDMHHAGGCACKDKCTQLQCMLQSLPCAVAVQASSSKFGLLATCIISESALDAE